MSRPPSLVLLAALAAACGRGKDAPPSPTTGRPAAAPGPAAPAAAAPAAPAVAAPAAPAVAAPAAPTAAITGCAVPADGLVKADLTLPTGCRVEVKAMLRVEDGATLAIQPGVTVAFASGAYLEVRQGTLLAQGSAAQPVVFTSRAAVPHAGDWGGLVFRDRASGGNTLDHVIIEYAGRGTVEGPGAVVVHQDGSVLAVTSTTIRRSLAPAIVLDGPVRFTGFHDNTIADLAAGDTAMRVDADAMREVGAGNHFGGAVHVHGDVTATATWPAIDGRYVIEGRVRVMSPHDDVTLTIAPGATLAFNADAFLDIGEEAGGGLIARDVTFTSASPEPRPGDWAGLVVFAHATATTIERCRFAYAGKPTIWGAGVIDFHDGTRADHPSFRMTDTRFEQVVGPAIRSSDGACGELADPAGKNTIDQGALCARDGKAGG